LWFASSIIFSSAIYTYIFFIIFFQVWIASAAATIIIVFVIFVFLFNGRFILLLLFDRKTVCVRACVFLHLAYSFIWNEQF
jgi:hypothetical protein